MISRTTSIDTRRSDTGHRPRSSRARLLAVAGAAFATLTWREYPEVVRYMRIRRM